MRRPVIAAALLAAAVAASTQAGSLASNGVPTSTAVHRSTSVSGATAVSIKNTVVAGKITVVTARLRKTGLLTTTVSARFGSDPAVVCVAGVITIINALTGLGEADYTCTGFLEDASRPRALRITAS